MMVFASRSSAGALLAERLTSYTDRDDVIVLALPRGGIPVAFEIAQQIHAPLDVIIVRRIPTPGLNDVAMGAIASGGIIIMNNEVMSRAAVPGAEIQHAIEEEKYELARREKAYRNGRLPLDVKDKTVIVVDDGLATGATMRAAIHALRRMPAKRIVVAIPVAAENSLEELRSQADEVVCLSTPHNFRAVSFWYVDFPQVGDDEARELLERAAESQPICA